VVNFHVFIGVLRSLGFDVCVILIVSKMDMKLIFSCFISYFQFNVASMFFDNLENLGKKLPLI